MTQYIYKIENSINGKLYIGQSSQSLEKRFIQHCSCKIMTISKAIKKYGRHNFQITKLKQFENLPQPLLNKVETYYIEKYKSLTPNGYNISKIGGKVELTKEQRNKISIKLKGRKITNYQKTRISESSIIRWSNPEERIKQRKILTNIIKERKEKHTISIKEEKCMFNSMTQFYKITTPDNIEFCSIGLYHVAKENNLDVSCLYKVSKGKRKHHKHWKVEEILNVSINNKIISTRDFLNFKALTKSKPKKYIKDTNKYLITPPNGYVFCTYGLSHLAEYGLTPHSLYQVAKGKFSQHKNWKCSLINDESIEFKKYGEQYSKYLITTPENISFCVYGLTHILDEFGVNGIYLGRLTHKNNKKYGKHYKNWKCELITEN